MDPSFIAAAALFAVLVALGLAGCVTEKPRRVGASPVANLPTAPASPKPVEKSAVLPAAMWEESGDPYASNSGDAEPPLPRGDETPRREASLPESESPAPLPPFSQAAPPGYHIERLPPIGKEFQPAPAPGDFAIPLDAASGELPPPNSSGRSPLVTLSVRGAQLHSVLSLIAEQQGLSIVAPSELDEQVTITLQPTTLENALDAVMAISNCTWTRVNDVIYVTPIAKESAENFLIQGREVRVFNLSYAAATDVERVVTGLLSPLGKVFTRTVDAKEKRKAMEQVVIEDLPPYVTRISQYIAEVDQAPPQVMIEARILQVKLEDDCRHGVNLDAIAQMAGADVTFKTQAFATGVGPAGILTVNGPDFDSLIDCLNTTNDTKTLAAPKLLMVNGQEAKIQIGRRLGYFVTTTTQTSTLQDVQFLEVGVVLTVTPQITDDGQIVMKVHPKVSSGDINPTTTLPEEETTEVDTSVMVADGCGMIIGGLIQETNNDRQTKVPYLGDVWLLGWFFQRTLIERERSEVIVALMPRIVPRSGCPTPRERYDLDRAYSPILTPTLESAPRPEPQLRDALRNPYLRPERFAP